MIFDDFAKRRARKLLSEYVSAEVIDEILVGSRPAETNLKELVEKQIDFVCVEVRGDTPVVISERMGRVSNLAVKYGAIVDSMISGLVVVVFGMVNGDTGDRKSFLQDLLSEFATDIRLVYGSGLAACGNLGSATRMSFSFILPGFVDALAGLAALPYGEAHEWRGKGTACDAGKSR